jgi:hypothetical protein
MSARRTRGGKRTQRARRNQQPVIITKTFSYGPGSAGVEQIRTFDEYATCHVQEHHVALEEVVRLLTDGQVDTSGSDYTETYELENRDVLIAQLRTERDTEGTLLHQLAGDDDPDAAALLEIIAVGEHRPVLLRAVSDGRVTFECDQLDGLPFGGDLADALLDDLAANTKASLQEEHRPRIDLTVVDPAAFLAAYAARLLDRALTDELAEEHDTELGVWGISEQGMAFIARAAEIVASRALRDHPPAHRADNRLRDFYAEIDGTYVSEAAENWLREARDELAADPQRS